jgi:hypothetical protein
MDDDGLSISPQELQKLNPNDSKELQQFLANEGQKSQVQKSASPPCRDVRYNAQSSNLTLNLQLSTI